MKKTLVYTAVFALGISAYGQNFSDNFDNYTAGDYLTTSNPAWSTWTGGSSTSEDVKISNTDASSAPNSLYFKSTSQGGGPTDIILRFDDVYTDGTFSLNFNIKVLQNKGAYFNLQQNHTPGDVWALDCYMVNNGNIYFTDGSGGNMMLQSTYPTNQWFNLRLDIDLTTNLWEVFVNNNSIGSFSNSINSIGIWDIFPVNPAGVGGNNQSEFYIDDVSYSHTPASLLNLNAGVTFINSIEGLGGQKVPITAKVRNLGLNPINSFDITYNYAGSSHTETVTGITLNSLATYEYTFNSKLTIAGGTNNLSVKVSNVNGQGADDNPSDDSKTIAVNAIAPAPGRVVVGEEATGTWCGWCPRGAVFMDYMAEKYEGYWAGIAVHNGDPMVYGPYDTGLGSKISGYPSALVDRVKTIDPSGVEIDFIERIVMAPKAVITDTIMYDSVTRKLDVDFNFHFNEAISGSWKVAFVLTEDSVTGTSSGYAQSNYYAGGGSGVMGGYESLPSVVPASQMHYNHVARTIEPSFNGDASLLAGMINAGDDILIPFAYDIPLSWNPKQMHVIALLIAPDGKIDNASSSRIYKLPEIEDDNGTSGIVSNASKDAEIRLYPNPAENVSYLEFPNVKENLTVSIMDLTGKIISNQSYDNLSGKITLPINTNTLAKGTYLVKVLYNGTIQQKKLIVQ